MTNTLQLPQQQTNFRSNRIQIILLFVAVFTLSLAAILIKLSEQYIGPNATIFNRFWIATFILGLWKGVKSLTSRLSQDTSKVQESYTIYDILLLVLTAILISLSQLSWAWSITQTSVANANLLHNMTPIFTILGGWLLFNYSFNNKFLMGVALAIGGAITISIQDLQISTDQLNGDSLALLSAIFFGANNLVVEKLRVKFSTISILLWSCFFRIFLTFPVVIFTEDKIFPSSLQGWLPVICLAIFCQVIGSGILFYSLKHFSSGFVSLFLLLEPIIATILAWVIFGEDLSLLNGLAFIVVLVGIYVAKSGQESDNPMKNVTEDI
jgi:drug/metabolite transporter (DMT)-like permease